jgi:hypothetical protein
MAKPILLFALDRLGCLLRSCPSITSHFSILAKVSLSLSKGDFCGLWLENPLEITLRQAQDDFSLDTKYEVVFGQILNPHS